MATKKKLSLAHRRAISDGLKAHHESKGKPAMKSALRAMKKMHRNAGGKTAVKTVVSKSGHMGLRSVTTHFDDGTKTSHYAASNKGQSPRSKTIRHSRIKY